MQKNKSRVYDAKGLYDAQRSKGTRMLWMCIQTSLLNGNLLAISRLTFQFYVFYGVPDKDQDLEQIAPYKAKTTWAPQVEGQARHKHGRDLATFQNKNNRPTEY